MNDRNGYKIYDRDQIVHQDDALQEQANHANFSKSGIEFLLTGDLCHWFVVDGVKQSFVYHVHFYALTLHCNDFTETGYKSIFHTLDETFLGSDGNPLHAEILAGVGKSILGNMKGAPAQGALF